MPIKLLVGGFICLGFFLPICVNATPISLKKTLLSIYASHPMTFLYDIPFNAQGKAQTALCAQCPSQEVAIQWSAIVPPNYYLNNQMCFKEKMCIDSKGARFGGIRCCRKRDPFFKQFENDLHNLVPELPNLKKTLHLAIREPENKLEDKLKGSVARAFLYMQLKYKIIIPKSDRILYEGWHRKYPATLWEKQRNQLIKNIQGDTNPYVEQ